MKITIFCGAFSGGGAERVSINLANCYVSRGIDVNFVVLRNKGPYKDDIDTRVVIINLDCRARFAISSLRNFLKHDNSACYLSATRATNIILGLASIRLKKRLVYREANTLNAITKLPFLKRWMILLLMRMSYKLAYTVICNSEDTMHDLLRYKVSKENKCRVIGNPVLPPKELLDTFLSAQCPHPWLEDVELKVFLNVGRLHRQKNQKLLIAALQVVLLKHSNARLIILGEGTLGSELRGFAEELGISKYVDICPFDENPFPYYRDAFSFVLSSNYEGFGNVLVEALSAGTPVISTDCPGGPRTILADGKYGLLVKKDDINEMSNGMISLLEGVSVFDSDNLKKHSVQYATDRIADLYLSNMNGHEEGTD